MKSPFDPIGFVERHGVVLAAAKGPVPNVAEAIAGGPIRGSWWGHEKGSPIFEALSAIGDSPDILCFRLVAGKITFVHRRLWAALVRLADIIGPEKLASVQQEHTHTGQHRNVVIPFPDWVPAQVRKSAAKLSEADARAALGSWLATPRTPRTPRPKKSRSGSASRRRGP
jgi:hypothetical protein